MPYKAISGIYRIVNQVNRKYYIGSAVSIQQRFTQHRRLLRQNQHFNSHLQAAWNKYGESSFTFETIETVPKELLLKAEQYWIDLCSVNNTKLGYNKRLQASTNLGVKASAETKKKLSAAHMGHKRSAAAQAKISQARSIPVVQIDFNGNVIKEYPSYKDAAEAVGAFRNSISMCCSNKLVSTAGYYWCKKSDLDQFKLPDLSHRKSHTIKNKILWKNQSSKAVCI